MNPAPPTLPLLTADLPGTGGRLRVQPDDFEVEEVPSYEPCGSGEHLYLWVEKRGIAPEFFARTIAQRLGVPVSRVGMAGLKDRYAVTRQWVSVPWECEPRLKHLEGDGIRVLKTGRHINKLKPGHLRGNRFRILIRDVDPAVDPEPVLARLREQGLPNYYGSQRFGRGGSTLELGWQCLTGRTPRRVRPFLFRFALSAVQSLLFNDYLARRLRDGLFRTVLPGDVLAKWPAGGLFVARDVSAEQPRFDHREIVHTGPMFGKKTYPAADVAAEREAAVLRDHGLSPASFAGFGKLLLGTRRHNLVYPDGLTATREAAGLRLAFFLPAGSYATVLLREVMKTEPAADNDDVSPADDEIVEE